MSLYLSTNSDGFNTEGIGALTQYQLHTYGLSKLLNVDYTFFGFKNLQHYQQYGFSQEKFCNDVNHFFNFKNNLKENNYQMLDIHLDNNFYSTVEKFRNTKENIVLNLNINNIMQFGDANLGFIENNRIFKDLKRDIYIDKKEILFSNEYNNISIHIRKLNSNDNDPAPIRELFSSNDTKKIINIIKQAVDKFSNKYKKNILNVFSQGEKKEFNFLEEIKDIVDIKLYIEQYPTTSLYHLINSDVLIMSNSSFSYVAHLLSDGITLVRDNFYHKTYSKDKFTFDIEGNINE